MRIGGTEESSGRLGGREAQGELGAGVHLYGFVSVCQIIYP